MNVETFAKILHEAGREAVEKKAVVNPNTHSRFLEWDELEEHMKEGRRIQARYVLKNFDIMKKKSPYLPLIQKLEKDLENYSGRTKITMADLQEINQICRTIARISQTTLHRES